MSSLDNIKKSARRWLKALRAKNPDARARIDRAYPGAPSDPNLRDVQHALAREQGHADWLSLRRALEAGRSITDLEQIQGQAQDFLMAYRTGDSAALRRLSTQLQREVTWDSLRQELRQRVQGLQTGRRVGDLELSDIQLLMARSSGCDTWSELVETLSRNYKTGELAERSALSIPGTDRDLQSGMLYPIELRLTLPMELHDGVVGTTTDVWQMLTATRRGDLDFIIKLVAAMPGLVRCEYNYMPPLHLAVREGHADIVRFLLEQGAYNAKYTTYPYGETLVTMADDRGFATVGALLREYARRPHPPKAGGGGIHGVGHIEFPPDDERNRLAKLINANAMRNVQALLERRPDLAHDPLVFYAEGVLAPAANRSQRSMLDVLMARGARVPDISKWGRFYYFKNIDVAAMLLDRGMSPNHMTWHRTTLLHDMAGEGASQKAALLLTHGADVNAIDDEFQSTPLGFAARWGRRQLVRLLLDHGADAAKAGTPWATPLAWAEKKGHREIAADLRAAGAR